MLGLINEWRRNSVDRQDFCTIAPAHDKLSIVWYIGRMIWTNSNATRYSLQATGLACLVALLCVCVIVQMLGAPFTLLGLFNADVLAESEPISEDSSALSPSLDPERPLLSHVLTDFRPVRHLPVVLTSVFRPPLCMA